VTLVDSNVLLDVLTRNELWYGWSSGALRDVADAGRLAINPIVFAEVSVGFDNFEQLDAALKEQDFERHPLPWAAAFAAAEAFVKYRRAGGARRSPLPDFYIGAHAAVGAMTLLTRDATRYRTYFPQLELIAPPA
jgi:predicted nucleic acid-binding protein